MPPPSNIIHNRRNKWIKKPNTLGWQVECWPWSWVKSSILIIACLLCHTQNLTLDSWDFFSHSRCQHTRFDLCSPIILSDVTSMAKQLEGFTQDSRSHLSHLKLCNLKHPMQSAITTSTSSKLLKSQRLNDPETILILHKSRSKWSWNYLQVDNV